MNLEELLDAMQDEMHSAHEEIEKFMGGNKSAGTRAGNKFKLLKIVKIIKGLFSPFFFKSFYQLV